MLILLASDLCRHIIKLQPLTLLQELQHRSAASDEVMLSAITYAELVAGVLLTENKAKHMLLVQEFCERLDDILPWDSTAVNCYTDIQMEAMEASATLNMNDAMLAAQAISLDAQLLTMSPKSFSGISNLQLKVWQESGING